MNIKATVTMGIKKDIISDIQMLILHFSTNILKNTIPQNGKFVNKKQTNVLANCNG